MRKKLWTFLHKMIDLRSLLKICCYVLSSATFACLGSASIGGWIYSNSNNNCYRYFLKVQPTENTSDIELDRISEEARQTDAIIDRLAEATTELDSEEHGTTLSFIRSGKRNVEACLGKESYENSPLSGVTHSGKRFAEVSTAMDSPERSPGQSGKLASDTHAAANSMTLVNSGAHTGSVSIQHKLRHVDSIGDSMDNNSLWLRFTVARRRRGYSEALAICAVCSAKFRLDLIAHSTVCVDETGAIFVGETEAISSLIFAHSDERICCPNRIKGFLLICLFFIDASTAEQKLEFIYYMVLILQEYLLFFCFRHRLDSFTRFKFCWELVKSLWLMPASRSVSYPLPFSCLIYLSSPHVSSGRSRNDWDKIVLKNSEARFMRTLRRWRQRNLEEG